MNPKSHTLIQIQTNTANNYQSAFFIKWVKKNYGFQTIWIILQR